MGRLIPSRADKVGVVSLMTMLIAIVVGVSAGFRVAALLLGFVAGFFPAYLVVYLATSHPRRGNAAAVLCVALWLVYCGIMFAFVLNAGGMPPWYENDTTAGRIVSSAFMG